MNIVLIPAWNRPDFLTVCLEHIHNARGSDRYLYVFAVDREYDPLVLSVIRSFKLRKMVIKTPYHPYNGGTASILEALKRVRYLFDRVNAERVHIIEDDVWIAKDFFEWHEMATAQYDPAIASACRNQNVRTPMTGNPDQVYYHRSYQSLGVSVSRETINLVLEYANESYYSDPVSYSLEQFPYSGIPASHSEQAGLFRRIVEVFNIGTLYAAEPRAYHAGFVGKNRPGEGLTGSLKERVTQLREMTDEDMNSRALDYKDIERCNMEGFSVEALTITQQSMPFSRIVHQSSQ